MSSLWLVKVIKLRALITFQTFKSSAFPATKRLQKVKSKNERRSKWQYTQVPQPTTPAAQRTNQSASTVIGWALGTTQGQRHKGQWVSTWRSVRKRGSMIDPEVAQRAKQTLARHGIEYGKINPNLRAETIARAELASERPSYRVLLAYIEEMDQ